MLKLIAIITSLKNTGDIDKCNAERESITIDIPSSVVPTKVKAFLEAKPEEIIDTAIPFSILIEDEQTRNFVK